MTREEAMERTIASLIEIVGALIGSLPVVNEEGVVRAGDVLTGHGYNVYMQTLDCHERELAAADGVPAVWCQCAIPTMDPEFDHGCLVCERPVDFRPLNAVIYGSGAAGA